MSFHPANHLPGCMMPDGGDCCAGHAAVVDDWHRQRREIEQLRAVAQPTREKALEAAALDFIAKVDRGEARSTKSYAAFKAALASQPSPAATVETLNEQAREHPRYDNPRDPFASPDRLPPSLSADSASPQLTDSRIFAESEARFPMGIVSASAWREGAKWARSQLAMPVEPQEVREKNNRFCAHDDCPYPDCLVGGICPSQPSQVSRPEPK